MKEHVHVVCPECAGVNRVLHGRLGEHPKCGRCRSELFPGRPVDLTGETFDTHLERSDLPLVVDFYAPWCGPCRAMAPAFERAAMELEPGVRLAKVNTDDEQRIAGRFAIRGVPTLIVFRGGREVARQSGGMDLPGVVQFVRRAVGSP